MTTLYRFVYTFHMPPFFFLAGIVAPLGKTDKWGQTKSKIERLMISYFVWAIIYWPLKIVFVDLARNNTRIPWWNLLPGNNPDGELWFLYVLFVLSLVTIWVVNEKTEKILLVIALILSILVDTFISKISLPMQPVPEIGSISVA